MRALPTRLTPLVILSVCGFLMSGILYAADANFYSMADRFEKADSAKTPRAEAVEQGFGSALSQSVPPASFARVATPSTLRRSLQELAASPSLILNLNQQLIVDSSSAIAKFVSTDEGVVLMETVDQDTLRILGVKIGRTFIHLWNAEGRVTFEIQVLAPRFEPSTHDLRQIEELEKSRSFKLGYSNDRRAFYTGDKYHEFRRGSMDFNQLFTVSGDSPYGQVAGHMLAQKQGQKTIISDTQLALLEGRIGDFKDFNAYAGDTIVSPGFFALPSAKIRGAALEQEQKDKGLKWNTFYGREINSSFLGTLSPGLITKRSQDSFLSGQVVDYQLNDITRIQTGYFQGYGRYRRDELNRQAMGTKGEVKLGPHVKYLPEVSFDSEHFANRHAFVTTYDNLQLRSEYRDISKKFFSLVGSPPYQGELGYRFDLVANPSDKWYYAGSYDIFRDRLIPNPDDPDRYNVHTDQTLTLTPWERTSVLLNYQNYDDTGRIGPTRSRTLGAQINQQLFFYDHRYTIFARYQNRRSEILTNSESNYRQNQFVLGGQTEIFKTGVYFSVHQEWNHLEEVEVPRITFPHAITYNLDYSHQIYDTPFSMEARLRYRDEERTESPNSFMSGEDAIELSGGIFYREYEDLELFLTGRFESFNPENLEVATPRVEGEVLTGMRYVFDTGWRWSGAGTFNGYVYKDTNGDGERQPEEQGLEGIIIRTSDGKEAVTTDDGYYEFKKVSGKKVTLNMDVSNLPYGYSPTSTIRQELPIINKKTQTVNFGVTPRSEISGIVFNDLNGDGKYQPTDKGLAKARVLMEDGKASRTNISGVYSFPNVLAAEHTVTLDVTSLPEGYLPIDVPKKTITVFEGIRFELNFPLRAARLVNGRVFMDTNKNGSLDEGETGLEGVEVSMGTQTVTTDKEGWYLFDNLNSGDYQLLVDSAQLPLGLKAPAPQRIDMPVEPATLTDKNLAVTAGS